MLLSIIVSVGWGFLVRIISFARVSAVFARSSSVFRFIVVCVGSISGV